MVQGPLNQKKKKKETFLSFVVVWRLSEFLKKQRTHQQTKQTKQTNERTNEGIHNFFLNFPFQ